MPAYAGPLHELVELHCLSNLSERPLESVSFTTGISGRRRGRVAPHASRSWACELDASDPSELGTLAELAWTRRGEAVWLVTEAARVQNILPPPEAVLDRARGVLAPAGWDSATDLTVAGRVTTVDGTAAATTLSSTGSAASPVVPVLAGTSVTASAYVSEGATVELVWVDPAGAESSAGVSAAAGPASGGMARVSVTATPDDSRTACRLVVAGADVYARPQITWTAGVVPWVWGKGAPKVHLSPPSEDAVMALTDGSRNLSSYSYNVTEVG